jgi:hypothetical protein
VLTDLDKGMYGLIVALLMNAKVAVGVTCE